MRVSINIIAQFISCMMISGVAFAATGIMSKYGTIQGVDGYSTNPFGSSKTYSYSNRMPVPVYENGPDVKTDECLSIVSNMVANACANMQNCTNASLSDIRPGIILQLSRMSGGNYATACAGYMDEAFRQYKQSHAHLPQNGSTAFPAATAPTQPTNTNKSAVPLNNFFETQKPAWAIEMQERTTELAEFQADNGKIYSELEPTAFPTTYADLSFSERMANNKAGYEPYQGKSAFKPIDIESLEDYNKRMTPTDEEYRKRCRNLLDELIRKLQNATSDKCQEILKQLKDIDNVHNWQDNCEKNTADALKKLEELKQAAIDNGCFSSDHTSSIINTTITVTRSRTTPVENFNNYNTAIVYISNHLGETYFTSVLSSDVSSSENITMADAYIDKALSNFRQDDSPPDNLKIPNSWGVSIFTPEATNAKLLYSVYGTSECTMNSTTLPTGMGYIPGSGGTCWCKTLSVTSFDDLYEEMENDTFTWESVGGLEAYDHGTRKTRNDCMTNEGYTCPMKCISYFLSGQKGIHPNIQKKQ